MRVHLNIFANGRNITLFLNPKGGSFNPINLSLGAHLHMTHKELNQRKNMKKIRDLSQSNLSYESIFILFISRLPFLLATVHDHHLPHSIHHILKHHHLGQNHQALEYSLFLEEVLRVAALHAFSHPLERILSGYCWWAFYLTFCNKCSSVDVRS